MKTLIIDDEYPAIQLLSTFVKKVPFLQLQLATTNAFEGLEYINKQPIDLLLLDIEMPDITGLELLASLKNPPMVIFTTAYEKYALAGYDLDIIDYLLKPIRFERFLKAVNKAQNKIPTSTHTQVLQKDNFLSVKVEYKTIRIAFKDILYVEGLKDYVKIFTTQEMILTRLNLKGIEAKLPNTEFIRIHRSFIVSLSKITAFQKSQVSIDNQIIPIGDAYRQRFLDLLS